LKPCFNSPISSFLGNTNSQINRWRGLLATTHDLLWTTHKRLGAVKFHREETSRDLYVAARVRDYERMEKENSEKEDGKEEYGSCSPCFKQS
jgi:hypothetical protein